MWYRQTLFLLLIIVLSGCTNQPVTKALVRAKLEKLELHSTVDWIMMGTGFAKHFNSHVTTIGVSFFVTEETTREEMLADTLAILKAFQPLAKQDRKLGMVVLVFMIPALDEEGNLVKNDADDVMGWIMLNMGFDQKALWETNFTNLNPARLEKLAVVYVDNIDENLADLAEEREWLAEEREE